ncbi:MAG TPA: hypothetical protein VFS67_13490 [Polyangiaceae bacterium]|nr:hypothetical protein [Polyangiaceae bacterium]
MKLAGKLAFAPGARRSTIWLLAVLAGACHSKQPPAAEEAAESADAPDRLQGQERLPDSETAFGLVLPPGMSLARHFSDSAYFVGKSDVSSVVLALQPQLTARSVEMARDRATFARTQIKQDSSQRWVRIEVSAERGGTQVYVRDVTPPPAPRGLSEKEIWSKVGRGPDGKPLNENQLY